MRALQKSNPLSGLKIENGQLYVYTDTSGYTNSYLFAPKSKTSPVATKKSSPDAQIDDIKLLNVRLTLDDQKKHKLYDFDVARFTCDIKTQDFTWKLKTKSNVHIHSLAFNTELGSYAKDASFNGSYVLLFNPAKKTLSFQNIAIRLKKHPFTLSGNFIFSGDPSFRLQVATKDLDYEFGKTLLTEKIAKALSLVSLQKPIDLVQADISGPLKGGDPLVHIRWNNENNNIKTPFANFTESSFSGSFTNEVVRGLPRKDPNSQIQLNNFSGSWEGLNVTCKNIYINDLKDPTIKCDLKTSFDLTQLNNLLESSTIDFDGGRGSVDVTYSGPVLGNNNGNTAINGTVNFDKGTIMYLPRNIRMNAIKGNIEFKNSDVLVNDLKGNVSGNKIVMNGTGKNLLAILKTNPGKLFIDWNIYSPSLNLGSFTNLLKKRVSPTKKKIAQPSLTSLSDYLDQVVNEANFHLDVKADELTYKTFTASNINASLGLINENWQINNVSLLLGGGSMKFSGNLQEKNKDFYSSKLKVDMNDVAVDKVMHAFQNFGQNGIELQNLRGKLSAVADVSMDIDRNLETPSDLDGYVEFSLKKGALLHYEPMQKLQNIVFKNRNFDEIYFAELKDRLDIKNREIKINRMAIESTVLTLFIEGIYSLAGHSDVSIQVPLSNLKKRDEDYELKNKDADAKAGASIYVRGKTGDDGNIQFKLDLFKKFRKDTYELSDSTH